MKQVVRKGPTNIYTSSAIAKKKIIHDSSSFVEILKYYIYTVIRFQVKVKPNNFVQIIVLSFRYTKYYIYIKTKKYFISLLNNIIMYKT